MSDAVFIAVSTLTVLAAILSLEVKEIVYGAIYLALSLLGVAFLFFLLNAPYVAAFQIVIYVGAIAVLIIFTVMLVREERWAKELPATSASRIAGIIVAALVVSSIFVAVVVSKLYNNDQISSSQGITQLGQLVSVNFSLILEVLALVLAASIIGALTLSKVEK